jgi:hypothetical protein
MGVLSFANTPTRGVHSKQRPTGKNVNKQKSLDVIPEDDGEKREELAETTTVEAIADEDTNMANEQLPMRANSPGACATPVREVPVDAREGSEDDTNNDVAEYLEYEGSLSLWWARVRREQKAGTHEVTTGVIATPTRGVPTFIEATTRANHAEPKEGQKEMRRARVEEVEDEGDIPARLRTEVYMHPEIAWPQTRTSSLGVRATPVREVPYKTSQRREDDADKTVAETHEERKEEMMGGEEEHTSCERGISMGVGAAPVRGVIPNSCDKVMPAIDTSMEWKEDEVVGDKGWAMGTQGQKCESSKGVSVTPARGVKLKSCQEDPSANYPDTEILDIDPKRPSREDADSAGVSETPVVETSWCRRDLCGGQRDPLQGSTRKACFYRRERH